MMMSIVALIAALNINIGFSEKELPLKTFGTSGEWFVGYVNAYLDQGGRVCEKGSSQYLKGYFSYQSACVKKALGNKPSDHLKLSSEQPGTLLAKMDGFTPEYWGLRGHLSALFKMAEPVTWSHPLTSFLQSTEQLSKDKIRKSLPFENGGVFTLSEQAFFKNAFATEISNIERCKDRLKNRDESLAIDFRGAMSSYSTSIKKIDDTIKPLIALRAPILFPKGKKKSDLIWSKKTLSEKLLQMDADKLHKFNPKHLSSRVVKTVNSLTSDDGWENNSLPAVFGTSVAITETSELGVILKDWMALLTERSA
jgi:hypothetical protein